MRVRLRVCLCMLYSMLLCILATRVCQPKSKLLAKLCERIYCYYYYYKNVYVALFICVDADTTKTASCLRMLILDVCVCEKTLKDVNECIEHFMDSLLLLLFFMAKYSKSFTNTFIRPTVACINILYPKMMRISV